MHPDIFVQNCIFSDLRFATLRIYISPMVWKSLWVRAGFYIQDRDKLANNNQFNYPQNIYSRIGFVIQTQRRRRRREGGREVISCCTMCFHFPDGLSSLLPDLVCVVLHSPVICVSSASIYTYHTDQRWVCHILVFYMFCLLLSLAWSYIGLFCRTGLHVRNTGITCAFIWTF